MSTARFFLCCFCRFASARISISWHLLFIFHFFFSFFRFTLHIQTIVIAKFSFWLFVSAYHIRLYECEWLTVDGVQYSRRKKTIKLLNELWGPLNGREVDGLVFQKWHSKKAIIILSTVIVAFCIIFPFLRLPLVQSINNAMAAERMELIDFFFLCRTINIIMTIWFWYYLMIIFLHLHVCM